MTTHIKQHLHTFTAPSSPGSLLWVPLDEVRQAWASFGAEALSCPALLATSTAFAALSWETSALWHHRTACQAQQCGLFQEAARWLDQTVQDLDEAVRNWRGVLLWLERLGTQQTRTEALEQVHTLSEQAAAQQQRLWHLIGLVQQEQRECRSGQATAPTLAASDTAPTPAAAGVQQEEE
jgi:hypothetical protein